MSSRTGRTSAVAVWLALLAPIAAIAQQSGGSGVEAEKKTETVRSKDGTSIAFERSGSGPVVVLVNGALSTRAAHRKVAALLAPHFNVISYDRRGRGESGDTKPYAVAREVEDIEALIDHSGGTAYIFGSSSGAALALEATTKLRSKVAMQALFEPPFIVDDSRPPVPKEFVSRVTEMIEAGRRGDAVEYFMAEGVRVPAEGIAQMRASPMWAQMEKLAHTLPYDGAVMGDLMQGKPLPRSRWDSVGVPTLVIDGERSDAYLKTGAQALAGAIRKAERRTLPGHDHSVVYTAPEAIAPVLIEFFAAGK